jgi:hypothetical protein
MNGSVCTRDRDEEEREWKGREAKVTMMMVENVIGVMPID